MSLNYEKAADEMLAATSFNKYDLPDVSEYSCPEGDEQEKIRSFLRFVKNPYLFRVGDIGVRVTYSGCDGDTLQSHICNLLVSKL